MGVRALALLSLITLLIPTSQSSAGPFTGIVAFGDSLSDAGNVFLATGGAIPAPPYVGGHFSNGPTWVERLSQNLGLGVLRPSLAGGTDFAFGSAVTGNSVPGITSLVPNITQQVGLFLSTTGGVAAPSNLYTMWIGSDDVYQAVTDVASNLFPIAVIQNAIGAAAQSETAAECIGNSGCDDIHHSAAAGPREDTARNTCGRTGDLPIGSLQHGSRYRSYGTRGSRSHHGRLDRHICVDRFRGEQPARLRSDECDRTLLHRAAYWRAAGTLRDTCNVSVLGHPAPDRDRPRPHCKGRTECRGPGAADAANFRRCGLCRIDL